jgi:hypothetical protein
VVTGWITGCSGWFGCGTLFIVASSGVACAALLRTACCVTLCLHVAWRGRRSCIAPRAHCSAAHIRRRTSAIPYHPLLPLRIRLAPLCVRWRTRRQTAAAAAPGAACAAPAAHLHLNVLPYHFFPTPPPYSTAAPDLPSGRWKDGQFVVFWEENSLSTRHWFTGALTDSVWFDVVFGW